MKNRIKRWLGITALEKKNESLRMRLVLQRTHMIAVEKRAAEAKETAEFMKKLAHASAEKAVVAQERVEKLADLFVVGLDYSPIGYDKSWVVVCIRGKMERVQFMDVSNKEAREIQKFLSMFNRENVTVDAGPISHMFKN
jgi:ribosomal protein L21